MTRLPLLPTLIVCSFPVISHAAEVWAPGITYNKEEGKYEGWVDFNKSPGDADYITEDEGMCWAASASNVITWWQTQNAGKLTSANKPTETYGIATNWDIFRTVYDDIGGTPSAAYDWYINGLGELPMNEDGFPIYPSDMDTGHMGKPDPENKTYEAGLWNGGFLKGVYDSSSSAYTTRIASGNSDSYEFSRKVVDALNDGYALSISAYDNLAHAYTLWGVEYNETDKGLVLTKAYITNSDDGIESLIEREIIFKETSISFQDNTDSQIALAWEYLDGMRTVVVPEPSAFGLIAGTLALALVAASRRRNRRR